MERLALFDFCGTIANFQTLGPYLEYVLSNESPIKYRILCNAFSRFFFRIIDMFIAKAGMHCFIYKLIMVRQMKGISRSALKKYGTEYYQQTIRDNLINETVNLLKKLYGEGYRIVIVSAGSDFYIRDFAAEYGIEDLITAEFGFTDEKCTGRLLSECMYEEKTERIKDFIRGHDQLWSCEIACSDSVSDLPMFGLCRRKIVISHGAHQQWVTKDMEEIIWG